MNLQEYNTNNRKDNSRANKLTIILFMIYLIVLFWILLFKLGVPFSYLGSRSVNLVPFSKPLIINGKTDIGEMILNVVIFIPLGIYAGVLFKKWTTGKRIFFFFLLSLLIEALQFMLAIGASDITDIITNTAGGITGFLLYAGIEKAFNNSIKAQKFINIIAAAGTVVIVSLLILLKMNMLPVRYQ